MRDAIALNDVRSPGSAAIANIPNRLERLPMTNYQRRIFAIIASAWLVDQ